MSEQIVLNASNRELIGSSDARRYRKAGQIPAVVYNEKAESISILIPVLEAKKAAAHHGTVTVIVDGVEQLALIKQVQYNFITDQVLHIDLFAVDATHVVQASVPVQAVGTPAGALSGGELAQTLHEIEVECLPTVLPEVIKIDVSELTIGSSLLVKDAVLPEGITAVTSGILAIFHLNAPKADKAATTEEEAD